MVTKAASRASAAAEIREPAVDLAFVRFVLALSEIGSVRRISYSLSQHLHLWVLLSSEDEEAEDRIWDLERDYLGRPGSPTFELHVLPLDRIAPDTLPPAETLVER